MSNQQLEQVSVNMPKILLAMLSDMEACVTDQESIIVEEREAMRVFNGDELAVLVDRRARSQSELGELESRCRRLVKTGREDGEDTRLEWVIETYAPDHADSLQSKRIELVRRMQTLERNHVENHIRLRAAWNVTTNILQQIGAIEPPTTYQNSTYTTQQVAR
ncbi:MAG: hypothetical protein R8M45_01285 [Ghiorsea sp.]